MAKTAPLSARLRNSADTQPVSLVGLKAVIERLAVKLSWPQMLQMATAISAMQPTSPCGFIFLNKSICRCSMGGRLGGAWRGARSLRFEVAGRASRPPGRILRA